ncbi:VWA domain-containing protein [Gordonia sp. ABSL1-1]|uniref:VWA domain-containing protein n=1 Tax=Gordonia sp. ABSL1-1 TaxID=3053923 RepID=UPI0025732FAD|nr:VWA domain-containing protein [Gordonia sp. ABSL1-1]MDL9935850.1 VWA domain-containing protein [Gordonia sp. ABSL1-1]
MFSHAWWLLLVLLAVALVALYVFVMRLRRKRAFAFANMDVLDRVAPTRRNPFTHIPIILMVVAVVLFAIAMAGPQGETEVPRNKATVVLVMDVSRSMNATDVAPSRIKAAQSAAKKFADDLTDGINLGLISFAGTPSTLVPPTPDHSATKAAIDKLQLDDKTATGEGIFAALQQIRTLNTVLGGKDNAPPAHIVLLSDGKQTVPDGLNDPRGAFTAARKAKEEGVPVSTISFGTRTGTVELEGDRVPVPVDDKSLKQIANLSGGNFFTAGSLDELNKVYEKLQSEIGYEKEKRDNYRWWLGMGLLFTVAAAAAGLLINRRLP